MAQFKTLDARLLRSVPLTDLTKHIALEVNGVTRFEKYADLSRLTP
jgi:hypothetical protein